MKIARGASPPTIGTQPLSRILRGAPWTRALRRVSLLRMRKYPNPTSEISCRISFLAWLARKIYLKHRPNFQMTTFSSLDTSLVTKIVYLHKSTQKCKIIKKNKKFHRWNDTCTIAYAISASLGERRCQNIKWCIVSHARSRTRTHTHTYGTRTRFMESAIEAERDLNWLIFSKFCTISSHYTR